LTHGSNPPDRPSPILNFIIDLRKSRSQLLFNAIAYGSRAIVSLRPAIPGPAFLTFAERGDQWDGTKEQLKRLS